MPIDVHQAANRRSYSDRDADESWRAAVRALTDPVGARVVDIGCGGGIYARAWHDLGAAGVTGGDFSEPVRRGRPRPRGHRVGERGGEPAGRARRRRGPRAAPPDLHERSRGRRPGRRARAGPVRGRVRPRHNPFAEDAAETLAALHGWGLKVAIVSDIHFDVRPAFDAAELTPFVGVFTLSCEQGVQKPDPAMFRRTLDALDVPPGDALMVGDRSRPDGAAVEQGITTLLLPPLRAVTDRRLHKLPALCDAAAARD